MAIVDIKAHALEALIDQLDQEVTATGRYENALNGYAKAFAEQHGMPIDEAHDTIRREYDRRYEMDIFEVSDATWHEPSYHGSLSRERTVEEYKTDADTICQLAKTVSRETPANDSPVAHLSPRAEALLERYLKGDLRSTQHSAAQEQDNQRDKGSERDEDHER